MYHRVRRRGTVGRVETLVLLAQRHGWVQRGHDGVHAATPRGATSSTRAGPHRVQRVPVTESQGRIHTSSATVTVLPEPTRSTSPLDERDLDVDVHRSSGPGGQSVNTTDSAVRITHRPSGIVVSMQDERSQLQNKARAMRVLRARLFELAELRASRPSSPPSGGRRSAAAGGARRSAPTTSRRTGHRPPHRVHLYRLDDVLSGDLQAVVDALAADERARLLAVGGDADDRSARAAAHRPSPPGPTCGDAPPTTAR